MVLRCLMQLPLATGTSIPALFWFWAPFLHICYMFLKPFLQTWKLLLFQMSDLWIHSIRTSLNSELSHNRILVCSVLHGQRSHMSIMYHPRVLAVRTAAFPSAKGKSGRCNFLANFSKQMVHLLSCWFATSRTGVPIIFEPIGTSGVMMLILWALSKTSINS